MVSFICKAAHCYRMLTYSSKNEVFVLDLWVNSKFKPTPLHDDLGLSFSEKEEIAAEDIEQYNSLLKHSGSTVNLTTCDRYELNIHLKGQRAVIADKNQLKQR